jgi:hypothetical protein
MPVKITIHTGVVFLDMVTLLPFSTIKRVRDHPAGPATSMPPCISSRLFSRAAGQTRSGPELLPPGPKPHRMKSQQLSLFPIFGYLILF